MRVEIINKPMLCWDDDEDDAREFHVLAKITECGTVYPYKVICNENTHPNFPKCAGWSLGCGGMGEGFKHAKPLPGAIELICCIL